MDQQVIISTHLADTLTRAVQAQPHDRLFVLTDTTTRRLCWPLVATLPCMAAAQHITIPDTDTHKTLDTVVTVWQALQQGGATRHTLLICLGGGMVTDLGGFAASTFKRGITYINLPTTLLAMVDASVGGKTGINFGGLKNEIGVFAPAATVILDTTFLRTLDTPNRLSGYAEMLKHGLISDPDHLATLLRATPESVDSQLVGQSVAVKQHIVDTDPHEQGIRKALNLGHTIGHAFESLALTRRPILHGYAVAYGLVCELWLSALRCGFPTATLHQVATYIRQHYGQPDYTCDDYPTLLSLMRHDKKNTGDTINFTLLTAVGKVRIDQTATQEEIRAALDFLREGF